MVKEVSPNSAVVKNCVKAFFSGGLICCFGQFLTDVFGKIGASKDDAGMYTTAALIFLGVLLTGLGVYDKIGKHTGAGSVVPITGFANSMAAPAVEFKKEGMIMGIGAKMFLVAGPVIVYGLITSVAVGVLYYIFGR
ncbi:MAG: stage V sporulation protein AC [Clostridiales bacterium]|jgi:stage V sporulation protein AC|nr:stage V sporulation protein AC [Clostridiales bacterium]